VKAEGELLSNTRVCASHGTPVSAHLAQAVLAALVQAKTVNEIRIVEGRGTQHYRLAIQSIVSETFCFQSRIIKSHQYNASDPFDLCLNYSYGVIEGYVRKAVNIVGLEPSVGFLHEFTGSQTKESLVYDLMEPFRWLGHLTTIQAFESGVLDLKDFYFTGDDYSYKIEIEAKRRFLQLLKDRFNSGANYKGRVLKWDTVIEQKTMELARYLTGRSKILDFSEPEPELDRSDSLELRRRILSLSMSEAQKLGIGKSTLRYLRRNAANNRLFKICRKVSKRLRAIPNELRTHQILE